MGHLEGLQFSFEGLERGREFCRLAKMLLSDKESTERGVVAKDVVALRLW